jgi:ATP-dependent Clp protease ATP-binding subunit ClpX
MKMNSQIAEAEDSHYSKKLGLYERVSNELLELGFQTGEVHNKLTYLWFRILLFLGNPFSSRRPVSLILGATGSSKTFSAETLCHKFGIEHHLCNCSQLTPQGIVGTNLAEEITNFYMDFVSEKHMPWGGAKGLLILDEVHCLTPSVNGYHGPAILHELLPILGGQAIPSNTDKSAVERAKKMEIELPPLIPTAPLAVLALGSFDGGLTRPTGRRLGFQPCMGAKGSELSGMTAKDLYGALEEKSGIPGELLGRMTVPPVVLEPPDGQAFRRVLASEGPYNPLQGLLLDLLGEQDCDVSVSKATLDTIIEAALDRGLGYRSLRQVCEEFVVERVVDILVMAERGEVRV